MRRTALDGPLWLFLISAAIGLGLAYDRRAAWPKFCLIVGGLALYYLLAWAPARIRVGRRGEFPLVSWAVGALPALIAALFLLTNDWMRWAGKMGWLEPIGRWFAAWQPSLFGIHLNPNVAGGVIAALLPLQATAWRAEGCRRPWPGWLLLGLSALGLLLSASRGAWLALSAAAGGWGAWSLRRWLARRWPGGRERQIRASAGLALLLLGGMAIALILMGPPWGEGLSGLLGERPTIWRDSRDLAGDYLFTGLGLGGFPMAYSSYARLVHVEYISHAHNLFLDVWLEQGLLGVLALAWLWGAVVWTDAPVSRWRPAVLAALTVILLHGLVDDPFYGYGGWAVPLLFVPLGLSARSEGTASAERTRRPMAWAGAGAAALLGLAIMQIPAAQAAWQANLGALAQTQAELSVYRWPRWPIQDAVRRAAEVDLSPAIAHYLAALALDPENVTAHRRLGQIALSRGDDEAARHHLQAAYRAAPAQRATRQLLGEVYAVAGEIASAVALWRTADVDRQQLLLRAWWYRSLGEAERAARLATATRALFGDLP